MATKGDFGEEQWQVLQWAVTDTMAYLSMSDPGFWDSFKEASHAARYIADQRNSSGNLLVRDLAGDIRTGRDKEALANPTDMASEVCERVSAAVALVAETDAADVPAFREFILGVAEATAEAAGGVGPTENVAMEKLREALGSE